MEAFVCWNFRRKDWVKIKAHDFIDEQFDKLTRVKKTSCSQNLTSKSENPNRIWIADKYDAFFKVYSTRYFDYFFFDNDFSNRSVRSK